MEVAEQDALALQRAPPAGAGLRVLTTDTGAVAASALQKVHCRTGAAAPVKLQGGDYYPLINKMVIYQAQHCVYLVILVIPVTVNYSKTPIPVRSGKKMEKEHLRLASPTLPDTVSNVKSLK